MQAKYAFALLIIGAIILSFNDKLSDRLVALYYRRSGGRRISYESTLKFNFAFGICLIVAASLLLFLLLARMT